MGMGYGSRRQLASPALALLLLSVPASPAGGATLDGVRRRPTRTELEAFIDSAAAQHGVNRELVRAVIQAESGFDHAAVSAAGALGLMQLMPATALRFGVSDPLDARQNILGGTRYLRVLLDTYSGDVSLSAAAYNAGEGAVARYRGMPPFPATRAYVQRVNALLDGKRPKQAAPGSASPAGLHSLEMTAGPCARLDWGQLFGWPGAHCPALAVLQRP